ncbi:hypothetical protein N0V93_006678 [Gnomoniopsis smithogilvyi]|uniref:Secreted protein NIS1 n=1 Tax=Gnomoniopsis smithogilvyi TaxID=1191159 RepID=A0A9W8YP28_9PEZI|nr:hypothetical protein N0V93_006678 [Gnomoniopsis smithogilvyi]
MHISTILAASASLLCLVQARIGGIGVPAIIKSGDTFDLIIEGTGYIQSVTDVSIAVGYYPGAAPLGDGLGIFVTAFDLVSKSNYDGNFNKSVVFPATTYVGAASFTASLESLYGVQYEPVLTPFNLSITIGSETSTDYIFVGLS